MPLLKTMLLSVFLPTPVEIGPSNASPGWQRKKERNGTNYKYDTRQDIYIYIYIYIYMHGEQNIV